MPNKEVNNITLEIGDMIETYDLTDSNNPVIELKDTVTENATAGTEQHVFKETTADGHENQVSDFLIAQKQISALRTNSTGDGLVMESYDQKATHQQTDLRLAQVTTNKNNIATANTNIQKNAEDIATTNKKLPYVPILNFRTELHGFGNFGSSGSQLFFNAPLTLPANYSLIGFTPNSANLRFNNAAHLFSADDFETTTYHLIRNGSSMVEFRVDFNQAQIPNAICTGFINCTLQFSAS